MSRITVVENTPADFVLFRSRGGPNAAYTLGGPDAAYFDISPDGRLTLKAAADFEAKSAYTVVVTSMTARFDDSSSNWPPSASCNCNPPPV